MKIIEVKTLAFSEIKVITFGRFLDDRGYFSEPFRRSDFKQNLGSHGMKDVEFVQANESYSKKGAVRGMHFQWNPYMGKLVRVVYGHAVDMALDIRRGSPNFGKMIGYEMVASLEKDFGEWIWLPPGFAHGMFFLEDSMVEYFCSGEYSSGYEAGISPLAPDIDWSACDPAIKKLFDDVILKTPFITDKDKNGFTLKSWLSNEKSNNFLYQ